VHTAALHMAAATQYIAHTQLTSERVLLPRGWQWCGQSSVMCQPAEPGRCCAAPALCGHVNVAAE
jgi:hypothetical protein